MANAAGQACRDYTPPGGETLEQVETEPSCKKSSLECCKIWCHLNSEGNQSSLAGCCKNCNYSKLLNCSIHKFKIDYLVIFTVSFPEYSNRWLIKWKAHTEETVSVIIQVKTRFKKFLKSLYQRMLEEHGSSDQCSASSSGPSEPEQPVIAGLASDGVHKVPVHALIVSHGAFIRVSVRHLVEDLQCCLPAGLKMNQVFSPCPNTGISRFIITLHREESNLRAARIQCVFINRKDHLDDVKNSDWQYYLTVYLTVFLFIAPYKLYNWSEKHI